MEMHKKGPGRQHSLPRGLCNGKPSRINKATALVHFFCNSISLYKLGIGGCHATGQKCPSYCCCTQTRGIAHSRLSKLSSSCNWHSSSPSTSPVRSPLCGHSPSGVPICQVPGHLHTEKVDHSSSSSLDHHHSKRTFVNPLEVKAGSEHSSAVGRHKLILGTETIFKQQGQELISPPSSPTVNLEDKIAAGSSKSQGRM